MLPSMAKRPTPKLTIFVLVTIVVATCSIQVSGFRGMVGGRMGIKDVKTNKEVQELGRYCVEEYNRSQMEQHRKSGSGGGGRGWVLMFSQVVEAERQVVSGVKYYLKIAATDSGGVPRRFNAVVVVQSWMENSRKLVDFSPSPATK